MSGMLRTIVKRIPPLRRAYYRRIMAKGPAGQSDEGTILRRLLADRAAPKTFVEFGFHPTEFNCAELLSDHEGLLIDGNPDTVADARQLLPRNVRVEQSFLTIDNLAIVAEAFPALGVLSIDVDGNDYWFLEKLIDIEPVVISVEYNASFGLEPVSVPYDPVFDRIKKHPSGWYHGASLSALSKLASRYGYGLAAVSSAGGNAFFTKDGQLDPKDAWMPSELRDRWSSSDWEQQWKTVRSLPLERV